MAYRKSSTGSTQSPAARITQEIIARLEAGTKPWVQPWRGVPVSRPLRACGIPYRGMNVFWLWMVADMCGYASPYWMTYNQAQGLGAQVRKGEKSALAIFYKSYTKQVEAPDTGERRDEARRVLKAYPVFNAEQVEGLPERFHPAASFDLVEPAGREAELDAFFRLLGGHPFLTRRGLHELANRRMGFDLLSTQASNDDGIYGEHLRRILVLLAKDPVLTDVVRAVLNGQPCPSPESFYRLRSAGVITGNSMNDCRPRCDLYATYLKRHLL